MPFKFFYKKIMQKKKINDFFEVYKLENKTSKEIPFAGEPVRAGFPSPADDFIDRTIDLNKELVEHPSATFFIKVAGDSMIGANIFEGDILIVDRALEPSAGDIVIAVVYGEFTLKRLIFDNGKVILRSENPDYESIEIDRDTDFYVWGVVRTVIRKIK